MKWFTFLFKFMYYFLYYKSFVFNFYNIESIYKFDSL